MFLTERLGDLAELVDKGLLQKIGEKKGAKDQLKFGGYIPVVADKWRKYKIPHRTKSRLYGIHSIKSIQKDTPSRHSTFL